MKTHERFIFLALALMSAAWACWCWYDPVNEGWFHVAATRAPTRPDRAALILFAAGRIAAAYAACRAGVFR